MYNIPRNSFALLCVFSLSSISFWSDTASASAAAASSSDARAASPIFLHDKLAAATSLKERLAIIEAAPADMVAFSQRLKPMEEVKEAIRWYTSMLSSQPSDAKSYNGKQNFIGNRRLAQKVDAISRELDVCNKLPDGPRKGQLQSEFEEHKEQLRVYRNNLYVGDDSLSRDKGAARYLYIASKVHENTEAYLIGKISEIKARAIEREQALIAENLRLRAQLQEKKKHKRSSSCER